MSASGPNRTFSQHLMFSRSGENFSVFLAAWRQHGQFPPARKLCRWRAILNGQSRGPFAPIVVAFRQGLLELGYVEGRVSRLSLFR